MKALSLTQPWATLVAIGAKKVETRSWGTHYRGPLAIHAAKGFPRDAQLLCDNPAFARALRKAPSIEGWGKLPLGAIVATVQLVHVVPTRPTLAAIARMDPRNDLILSEDEVVFGDFSEGRYAWILADAVMVPEPVPARGSLGLWTWTTPLQWPFA